MASGSSARRFYLNAAQWADLGAVLERRYEETGNLQFLDGAIGVFRAAIRLTPADDPQLSRYFTFLSNNLRRLHARTDNPDDLKEAISTCRQAVETSPENSNKRMAALINLGDLLYGGYLLSRKIEDLEETILVSRQALNMVSQDQAIRPFLLDNFAVKLQAKYVHTQEIADWDSVLETSRQVMQATREDHPEFIPRLERLGSQLRHRYERTKDIETLQEMRQIAQQAIRFAPKVDLALAELFSIMGTGFGAHCQQTGNLEVLNEAIIAAQKAIDCTPDGHDSLPDRFYYFGRYVKDRFERTNRAEDLENAIDAFRQAVKITPDGHPSQPTFLFHLGMALKTRFGLHGQYPDLEEAIEKSREAAKVAPEEHHDLPMALCNLCTQLQEKYLHTGKMEDLDEAIEVGNRAARILPEDHPDSGPILSVLGSCLGRRFEKAGNICDLQQAATASRRAVDITPKDHPVFSTVLHNLALQLYRQYKRWGAMTDLNEAIDVVQGLAAKDDSYFSDFPSSCHNLAAALLARYEDTRKFQDVEDAVKALRKAIDLEPQSSPQLGGLLNVLAGVLVNRYHRTQDMDDLEEAIQVSQRAVDSAPDDHYELSEFLNNLGIHFATLYWQTKELKDLEKSLETFRRAIVVASEQGRHVSAQKLENLATSLGSRYKHVESKEDLQEAIRICREAINIPPEDDPSHAHRKTLLAQLLLDQDAGDLSEPLNLTLQAWNSVGAPPLKRIQAASLAIELLIRQSDFEKAYKLCTATIDILPQVHNRSLAFQDQQEVVQVFSGLATRALALALQTGQPPIEALDLLERGRGVILSLLMDDRSDTVKLQEAHPRLCAEYESLQHEMNRNTESDDSQYTVSQRLEEGMNAIKELEGSIQKIQLFPGFSSFQKGLTPKEATEASERDRIIIVNVTDWRSDVLVLSDTGLEVINLHNLDPHKVLDWIKRDLTLTSSSDRGEKNKAYTRFLAWLWKSCVKPILDELQYQVHESPEDMPRVWWIGTGLASSFPFNAAGDPLAEPNERTSSRVLSSYTPSVKALLYSRARTPLPNKFTARPNMVMVSMATTPGADDLAGVLTEISAVKESLGSYVQAEILSQPDAATVKQHLSQCHIAHFACHGVSNPIDPSRSGLLLQTATTAASPPKQDILTVRSLCETTDCPQGQIAYLSACSTAENRSRLLVDEVLHVVSGFQVAGFRNVIGCLWPADDSVCVEIARSFYSQLCQNGRLQCGDRAVSLALHKAVLKIAKSPEYRKRPLHWAQYVHFGA